VSDEISRAREQYEAAAAALQDSLRRVVESENVAMRGIDYFLDQMASSLTAHAEHPVEVRDIAISLRSKAAALRRQPQEPIDVTVDPNLPAGSGLVPYATGTAFRLPDGFTDVLSQVLEEGNVIDLSAGL
jgi:hypothetical protein